MKATPRLFAAATVAVLAFWAPALALGPVDFEVTALYWNSETEVAGVTEGSADVGGRAELWFKRLGVSAALFQPNPEDSLDDLDFEYLNLDVKWRLINLGENNFFAAGVGYQTIDLKGGGFDDDSAGPRLVADGRIGLTSLLYFYGRAAYLPELDDFDTGVLTFSNGSGTEFEFGLQLKPLPFIQLFGGYRSQKNEYDTSLGSFDFEHDGIVVGAGVNF